MFFDRFTYQKVWKIPLRGWQIALKAIMDFERNGVRLVNLPPILEAKPVRLLALSAKDVVR
jgi:hypothetical protein